MDVGVLGRSRVDPINSEDAYRRIRLEISHWERRLDVDVDVWH
jgi:hypothetical protein